MGGGDARFAGRVAIVTGAGAGMGRQVALDLAREGARVVGSDIDAQSLDVLRKDLESLGAQCLAVPCDMASRAQVDALVAKTMGRFARLDILINNAGLLLTGTIEETTDEIIDRTLDVNVKGILYAVRAVTPIMKEQGYGRIVNNASITGKNGDNSTVFAYGASKGAVISLTRSVARQLGPFGVTANAVAPHAIMTGMMSYWDEEKKKSISDRIPVRRLGTVEDVSALMRFLASEEAGFINGETVNINGGYYMD
jgi:3-oxoacyl-[acyl-carrier protein] reductase